LVDDVIPELCSTDVSLFKDCKDDPKWAINCPIITPTPMTQAPAPSCSKVPKKEENWVCDSSKKIVRTTTEWVETQSPCPVERSESSTVAKDFDCKQFEVEYSNTTRPDAIAAHNNCCPKKCESDSDCIRGGYRGGQAGVNQVNPPNNCFNWCQDGECKSPSEAYKGDAGCYTKNAGILPGPSFATACSLSVGVPSKTMSGARVSHAGSTLFQYQGTCDNECKLDCTLCSDHPVMQMFTSLMPGMLFFTGGTPSEGVPAANVLPAGWISMKCFKCQPNDPRMQCRCPPGYLGTPPDCVVCDASSTLPECRRME